MRFHILLALPLFAVAVPTHATTTTIFSEDFSGATPNGSYSGAIAGTAFTVTSKNVDIVGVRNGSFFTCIGNPGGNCLDLVGNQGAGSSIASSPISLKAGDTYKISFTDLLQGYNPGDSATSLFTVSLGAFSQQLSATPNVAQESLTFKATVSDPLSQLTFFADTAPDNVHGPVLSGITITQTSPTVPTPEPASMVLFGLAVGAAGLAAGNRRRA